jgi:hypothetical protein
MTMFASAPHIDDNRDLARPRPPSVLFGRYMLPNMSEHPCQIAELALESATFLTDSVPQAGTPIVAYIDEIGRIEATAGEAIPGGFKVNFSLSPARRARLEQRLKWLADKSEGSSDQRRHARYKPKDNKSHITLPDSRIYPCEVIDISLSGAAVKTEIMPALGTYLLLGKMRGRVVRYLDNGFAIEFTRQLDRSALASQIR